MNSCCCVALISLLPSLTNQYLCKWYRPSYHDDRPYWKPPTSGEDSSLRYIQEQNQKNLGEVQSMVYQDKLMTTLWKSHLHFTCHLRWSLHSMVLVCLQYVQSVLCVKCVSFYVHLFMYIHPCLVFMDILGKSIFYVIVKKKKKKNLEKAFMKAGENFQCPRNGNISGDLCSTLLFESVILCLLLKVSHSSLNDFY